MIVTLLFMLFATVTPGDLACTCPGFCECLEGPTIYCINTTRVFPCDDFGGGSYTRIEINHGCTTFFNTTLLKKWENLENIVFDSSICAKKCFQGDWEELPNVYIRNIRSCKTATTTVFATTNGSKSTTVTTVFGKFIPCSGRYDDYI